MSRVGPITQQLKFCGLKSIMSGFFEAFATRVGREPDEQLLSEMISPDYQKGDLR